jgi:hypothetical protein
MRHYFFDFVSSLESLSDYEGRWFAGLRNAREHAKLLAIQCNQKAPSHPWSIVVRDPWGRTLHMEAAEDLAEIRHNGCEERLFV